MSTRWGWRSRLSSSFNGYWSINVTTTTAMTTTRRRWNHQQSTWTTSHAHRVQTSFFLVSPLILRHQALQTSTTTTPTELYQWRCRLTRSLPARRLTTWVRSLVRCCLHQAQHTSLGEQVMPVHHPTCYRWSTNNDVSPSVPPVPKAQLKQASLVSDFFSLRIVSCNVVLYYSVCLSHWCSVRKRLHTSSNSFHPSAYSTRRNQK